MLAYLLVGTYFGIVLYKGEVISWFRIQEMFRFHGFHMYGVMLSAVLIGALSIRLMRAAAAHSMDGETINVTPKPLNRGTAIGGVIFGMGWALTGACPGPLYAHIGAGTSVMIAAVASALLGVWAYALLRPRLPH